MGGRHVAGIATMLGGTASDMGTASAGIGDGIHRT
jgi:hypothetical protein